MISRAHDTTRSLLLAEPAAAIQQLPDKDDAMKFAPVTLLVLVTLVACNDEQKKAAAPTAPSATSDKSATALPIDAHASTVCLRYSSDREVLIAELQHHPKNEKLQNRLASVERLIKNTCQ